MRCSWACPQQQTREICIVSELPELYNMPCNCTHDHGTHSSFAIEVADTSAPLAAVQQYQA